MLVLQVIVSGALIGGIYALVAVGLNLVFGVLRIINFAHGDYLMLGMYASWFLWREGMDPYLSILVVVPLLALFGALTERFLIRYTLAAHAHVKIFVTLGLSIALQNLALLLFKADYLSVRVPYQTDVWQLLGVAFSVPRLIAFGAMFASSTALFYFLGHTDFGRAIRATAQDRDTARLMGIDVDRVYLVTFAIGYAFVVAAFVIVVLGGLGSLHGALVGGVMIGVVEQLSGFFIDTSLRQVVYFVVFMLMLAIKPAGLFGQRGAEEIGLK